ncbi:MAG: sugar ABC transporter ATP-binding protein [Bryobacteraceae bacterium]
MTPVLEAIGIKKSFGGVRALKGVSMQARRGEVHAIVGENGAGKSTLIKTFAGAIVPDEGQILIDGHAAAQLTPAKSRALGVAVIYQQPALFPDLAVAENIALARESRHLWRRIHWRARNDHAALLLNRIGSTIRPQSFVSSLSMPEQQLVEIAKALDAEAKVIIMDEPTASLGDRDAQNLFRVVNELRSKQCAVIYISHRFEELFELADCVTVLRDGESLGTFPMKEMTNRELIRLMVGRELETAFPKRDCAAGEPVLEVRNVSSKARGVHNVSFTLRQGEVLGMAGLVGSGRTQFAETLFGLSPADGGSIYVEGKLVRIPSPQRALELGIAYVPEDRRKHGVVMDFPISLNATLASLGQISTNGFLQRDRETQAATEYYERFRIKAPSIDSLVKNLSGGNQQKVSLARWLMTKPRILILDEPTQGIDVGAKSEIYTLIAELASRGLAILLISSELPEVLGLSDRIAVMHRGTIAGILDRTEADAHRVMELALGHGATVA